MAFSTSASIANAIAFLVKPLVLIHDSDMIASVETILHSTLQATQRLPLTLSFSATSLPPRPIYAACIATGVQWAEWMVVLGSRDFDLTIEQNAVLVTYFIPQPMTITVWSGPIPAPTAARTVPSAIKVQNRQVPISKLVQHASLRKVTALNAGFAPSRVQARTEAQQLMDSDAQEADEIFSMLSKMSIVSPTPTRNTFDFGLDVPSMVSPLSPVSPESSRPSSRSSTFSTFSFSDDEESVSSASSTTSFDFLASTKPTFVPSPIRSRMSAEAAVFVPQDSESTQIIVDTSKTDKTKYLYNGGVSTVLTGGVMLGGASTAKISPPVGKPAPAPTPKYRAPIGTKQTFAIPTNLNKSPASLAPSWRRSAPIRV